MPLDTLWLAWLQLLIVAIGFAVMFRARRLLRGLLGMLGAAVLAKLLVPLLNPLLIAGVMILVMVVFLSRVVRVVLEALLGEHAAGTVLGAWALRAFDAVFLLPVRAIRYVVRRLREFMG